MAFLVQFIERYLLALSIYCKAVYKLQFLSRNEIHFIANGNL